MTVVLRPGKLRYFVPLDKVRMHLAQRILCDFLPSSTTRTFCKLGRNFRFVDRKEKLRLCPNVVVFPHISHFAIARIPFMQ